MVTNKYLTLSEVSELIGKSKGTLRRWDREGKLVAIREPVSNYRIYPKKDIEIFFKNFIEHKTPKIKMNNIKAQHDYKVVELFAGAGGLAIGLEKAGLNCIVLNEIDKYACQTLKKNRPNWNILEGDIKDFNFTKYYHQADVVTGGFPCQAFSYAGKKLGLADARGTLFYEFARVVKEICPPICIGENVRGLLSHDNGKTIQGMISILDEIGYRVVPIQVLKAVNYRVPQKRERLILVGIRKDINCEFIYPKPYPQIYTLKDALKKGELCQNQKVPNTQSQNKRSLNLFLQKDTGEIYHWIFKKNIWEKVTI